MAKNHVGIILGESHQAQRFHTGWVKLGHAGEIASCLLHRHGLTARQPSDAKFAKAVKRLTREIAGGSTNRLVIQSADIAAPAHFDVVRIRELEAVLIEREFAFVESDEVQIRGAGLAEGVRRVLPQLIKLSRYSRRATNMRDRALLTVKSSDREINNQR